MRNSEEVKQKLCHELSLILAANLNSTIAKSPSFITFTNEYRLHTSIPSAKKHV